LKKRCVDNRKGQDLQNSIEAQQQRALRTTEMRTLRMITGVTQKDSQVRYDMLLDSHEDEEEESGENLLTGWETI